MAESTKRNQALMEDDFEAERIRQTQEQKNKTTFIKFPVFWIAGI